MKKILLSLFCLSMVYKVTVAQSSYIPFPNPCYWRVDASDYDPGPSPCSGSYYYHYSTGNDTIINSKTYVKIIGSPVTITFGSNPCYFYGTAPGYIGALRDDTIANKVFFIYYSQNTDSLLFDYNLNLGDTAKGIFSYTPTYVSSIDSVLINSQYHRRWNLFSCGGGLDIYFIKGIGSSLGLMEVPACSSGTGSALICVKDSTGTLYSSGISSPYGCQLITSTNDLDREQEIIKIFPNPVSSVSEVILPNVSLSKLKILNSVGEVVFKAIGKNILDFKIHAEKYSPGIYFLIASSKELTYSTKFIIQK